MKTLTMKTVGQLIDKNACEIPDQKAVIYEEEGISYTWARLNWLSDKAARGLMSLGVQKGNHVAIWGTNIPEWFITQIAAAKIGAVLITINPEWKTEELQYALRQSNTNVLVMMEKFVKKSGDKTYEYDYIDILKKIVPEIEKCDLKNLRLKNLINLRSVILVPKKEKGWKNFLKNIFPDKKRKGFLNWQELLKRSSSITVKKYIERQRSVTCNDILLIQYTSGTTGFPKGAMLSHYNIVNNSLANAENMELTNEDKICGPVPYYHIFGSVLLNMAAISVGATIVIPSEHFNARKTLEAIEKEKCTAIHGVPTMFISELADPEFSRFNLKSLRTGVIAGASCSVQLMEDIAYKMGAKKITIVYGLSEASPIITQTRPDDSIERRVSTVGQALDNVKVKIIDPETQKEVGINEVGELWAKGYNVMYGYYKKPTETHEAISNGWLRTGDLATKDKNGYYNIVGRLKDMIIVGGHNVYPVEIENALREIFENIEDVYVVGVPHEKLQEVPAAVIKMKADTILTISQIKEKCAERMEWTKIPQYVKFVQDFSAGMTVTGKIQKHKFREILVKELRLEHLTKIKNSIKK